MRLAGVLFHKTKTVVFSEFPEWILRINEADKEQLEKKDRREENGMKKIMIFVLLLVCACSAVAFATWSQDGDDGYSQNRVERMAALAYLRSGGR